jgi:hypothetical protein
MTFAETAKEFFFTASLYIDPQSRKFDAPQHLRVGLIEFDQS